MIGVRSAIPSQSELQDCRPDPEHTSEIKPLKEA